jgi:hypothetical protein
MEDLWQSNDGLFDTPSGMGLPGDSPLAALCYQREPRPLPIPPALKGFEEVRRKRRRSGKVLSLVAQLLGWHAGERFSCLRGQEVYKGTCAMTTVFYPWAERKIARQEYLGKI